jgi:uncharacterized membrane protein
MSYMALKYWHILSAIVLFGTGLGTAFFKWMADRSGNLQTIAVTNKHVVLADWLFTTPTVIMQPLTGIWMVNMTGWTLTTPWIAASLGLYLLAGACWLPVVWIQIQMKRLSQKAMDTNTPLTERYWRLARLWFWLGVPAFISMVIVVLLMVFKHTFGVFS